MNWTLVESQAEVEDNVGIEHSKKRPLTSQSPYVVNTGLFYSSASGSTQGSLLFSAFREASLGFGAAGAA
ncbi:MAG: hypothetical protein R3E12_15920 [Candidatus Eisenbacteria bacterium]